MQPRVYQTKIPRFDFGVGKFVSHKDFHCHKEYCEPGTFSKKIRLMDVAKLRLPFNVILGLVVVKFLNVRTVCLSLKNDIYPDDGGKE